jgi:hypothetical protein
VDTLNGNGLGLSVVPVERSNWDDFEAFFAVRGKLNNCWCMAWRMTGEELRNNTSACRKEYIRARVWAGIPIGLLAYRNGQPVAWCSVAPRETHQRLGGDERIERVWSLTCFFIVREMRHQALVQLLIDHAKTYAASNGAAYLEAYPVDPDSPSYRFMGFVSTFEKAGFNFVKDAGTRRHVMVCKL